MLSDIQSKVDAALRKWDEIASPIQEPSKRRHIQSHTRNHMESMAGHIASLEELSDQATFRPWDFYDYLIRLQTYSPLMLSAQFSHINPSKFAGMGWFNAQANTLVCSCCRAVFDLSHEETRDSSHLETKISSWHKVFCPWTACSCPASFESYPITSPGKLLLGLQNRIFSLLKLDALPTIELPVQIADSIASLDEADKIASRAFDTTSKEPLTSANISGSKRGTALILAIFGWEAVCSERDGEIMHCTSCGRRVGRWNFECSETCKDDAKVIITDEKCSVKLKPMQPIEEHRYFCPWIADGSKMASSIMQSQAGWKQTLSALLLMPEIGKNGKEECSARTYETIRQMLKIAFS